MTFTATYDPADDKLRLYASARLDAATYERAKKLGFRWAPRQDLFFAMWHPLAEDFCTELTGEIEDEEKPSSNALRSARTASRGTATSARPKPRARTRPSPLSRTVSR